MMGSWNWDTGNWLGMGVTMLVWLVVVVAVVWLLIRLVGGDRTRSDAPPLTPQTPDQILRERYARGEIDVEEYRQRSEVLKTN